MPALQQTQIKIKGYCPFRLRLRGERDKCSSLLWNYINTVKRLCQHKKLFFCVKHMGKTDAVFLIFPKDGSCIL